MKRYVFLIPEERAEPRGGIMNMVRHCSVARRAGAAAILATYTGKDAHGRKWFRHSEQVIRWGDRRPDDIVVIPDLFSENVEQHAGPCIVYQHVPVRLYTNFDYMRDDLQIWTDSSFMREKCQAVYPGKPIAIIPNVVDPDLFPFTPQQDKQSGMIIVFPRKGEDFIKDVFKLYKERGGRHWKPKRQHRLRLDKMARVFCRAEAFLASAELDGSALPPQEAMSAGVVVVGKDAAGANFSMQHERTALVSESVEDTVSNLQRLEDRSLREQLARAGHEFISRYFPDREPAEFWARVLAGDV